MKFLNFIFLSVIFFLFPSIVFSEEAYRLAPRDAGAVIPVYEEMLARQVYSFYLELNSKKQSPLKTFFLFAADEESGALVSRLSTKLKNFYPETDWKTARFPNAPSNAGSFEGIVFIGFKPLDQTLKKTLSIEELNKAAKLVKGSDGFILILINEYINRGWLDSIAEDAGLETVRVLALRELEFAEDEAGRQIINLDLPKFQNPIYEHLVQGGMNPVNARVQASQLVKNFRRAEEPKILILADKNL